MPVLRRLTHFTLHFSKYVGSLAKAYRERDNVLKHRVITDSFIIALAAANAMNVDLERQITSGVAKIDAGGGIRSCESLVMLYAEVVGEMAKACEALDHLEDYPYRSVLERSVVLVTQIIVRLAALEEIDLSATTVERWKSVEHKQIVTKGEGLEEKASSRFRIA